VKQPPFKGSINKTEKKPLRGGRERPGWFQLQEAIARLSSLSISTRNGETAMRGRDSREKLLVRGALFL